MIHTYISSILMDSKDFKSWQDLSDSSGHRQQIRGWLPSFAMIPKAWEVQNSDNQHAEYMYYTILFKVFQAK